MPVRVGLLTTLDHNIGDDFIREGILAVARQLASGRSLEFIAINKHQPLTSYPLRHPVRLAESAARRLPGQFRPFTRNLGRAVSRQWGRTVFDTCNIIIQCGTPVLWPGCRNSEWAGLIWRDIFAQVADRIPILNVGGGSCYPWSSPPTSLQSDDDEEFARLMGRVARLTTVRDSLAQTLFASIDIKTDLLPCPALLAAPRGAMAPLQRRVLLNYMPGGGHFDWNQGIPADVWEQTFHALVTTLRKDWSICMLCHDEREESHARRLWPDIPRATPRSVADYFAVARGASFGVFNRLHAGIGVAGLGIPSICIGTDTRMLMASTLGLKTIFVREATLDRLMNGIAEMLSSREKESRRLEVLRERTFADYRSRLAPYFTAT